MPKSNFVAFSVSPLENTPVQYLDYKVPKAFKTYFYDSTGSADSGDCYLVVELEINLGDNATPRATSAKIFFDPKDSHSARSVRPNLQRWHFEAVEGQFHELLSRALIRCIQTVQYKTKKATNTSRFANPHEVTAPDWKWEIGVPLELSSAVLKLLAKETQRLTHRRPNDNQLFKKVAAIYNKETKRAKVQGTRGRQIKEIMAELSIPRGTAEMYVRSAKAAGLIKAIKITNKPISNRKRT